MATICLHTLWNLRSDFIGGTERFLIDLCKELNVLGHQSFIVCSNLNPHTKIEGVSVLGRVPPSHQDRLIKYGDDFASFARDHIYPARACVAAYKEVSSYVKDQLRDLEFDILHLNSFSSAAFIASKNCVVTNHENEEELDTFWHSGAFGILKAMIRSDKNIFPPHNILCTPSFHYAQEYSLDMQRNIQATPLGIDLHRLQPSLRPRQYDRFNVLVPSRFFPAQKGQDVALEACRVLVEKGIKNITFTFTGVRFNYSSYVEEFLRRANDSGVRRQIEIKTFRDMQEAYDLADVVVSPERYCSYGLSVSEGLAHFKPTVLTAIPTYIEIAQNYRHAFFFRVDHAIELADRIVDAIALDRRIAVSEGIVFRENNDIRDCARNYSRIYRSHFL